MRAERAPAEDELAERRSPDDDWPSGRLRGNSGLSVPCGAPPDDEPPPKPLVELVGDLALVAVAAFAFPFPSALMRAAMASMSASVYILSILLAAF